MSENKYRPCHCPPLLVLLIVVNLGISSFCFDTILPGEFLSGNKTISSENGVFELGFFSPGNSNRYYVGIWYKNQSVPTSVWVANVKNPVKNPFLSVLKLSNSVYGDLVLENESKFEIWSANLSSKNVKVVSVRLLDTGNLIITGSGSNSSLKVLWQSFDHPTNTWLPGGKIGYKKHTQQFQKLVSWKNSNNPSPGRYSIGLDRNSSSHLLYWNESKVVWSSGPWNGKFFTQVPEIQLDYFVKNMTYIVADDEKYFTYEAAVSTTLTRFIIDSTGQLKQFVWPAGSDKWILFWSKPEEQCEVYAFCGSYSICRQNEDFKCKCLEGFKPENVDDWKMGDHSDGCVRNSSLKCGDGIRDGFYTMSGVSLPDDQETMPVGGYVKDCEMACLMNCSCSAYAVENGVCSFWNGALMNLQQLGEDDTNSKSLRIRLSASDAIAVENAALKPNKRKQVHQRVIIIIIIISISSVLGLLTLAVVGYLVIFLKRRFCSNEVLTGAGFSLTVFKFRELKTATKSFSEKLGEGAFGSVFKGALPDSTLIAVKELKCVSNRGEKQFRAEVSTIGTIQHINLVRLHGFCAEGTKRYLVYEYIANGSLNTFLFRNQMTTISPQFLNWSARYKIAISIAKGLAYLHEDCAHKIVHCDIKPENILLNEDFIAKVADFGLAKLIDREYSRAWTTIRGTKGYLAPEWISGEAITPKADVFSYGMLLFELISGKRNRETAENEIDHYFPKRVLDVVTTKDDDDDDDDSEILTLLDERFDGNVELDEVVRMCRVACWCIQDEEKDRPTMGKVVQILEGVLDVGIPTVPRFIKCLSGSPKDAENDGFLTSSHLGLSSSV